VIVLSNYFDLQTMIECFTQGAQGYIINSVKSARLLAALRLAALGEKVVPSDFVDQIGCQPTDYSAPCSVESHIEEANLSPREVDVLCCLMAGYANKVIARKLDVCEATVKVHVKSILRKLNVRNRTQAAIWANSRHLSENYCVF
jgi:two-component system nitrate/nitrite response regulator NarL